MSKEKIILITGASSGIGLETAKALLKQGHHIIMINRNRQKSEHVIEELIKETDNNKIDLFIADLSLMAYIYKVTEEINKKYDHIDVLINNAGSIFPRFILTKEGNETTFATNHLSAFLITKLLLDKVKKAEKGRIVTVSSAAHYRGHLDLNDLQYKNHPYEFWQAYGNSKLCNVLFTYELARSLEGTNVTANCLHPGLVNTNFVGGFGSFLNSLYRIFGSPFMISSKQGAITSVYLATSEEVEGITGKYFYKCKVIRSSKESYNVAEAKRLWEESEKLVK